MEHTTEDYKNIPGWGMDADPENEPTYPMKHWTGDDHQRLGWVRPPQQPATVELLKSTERPNISAVFGTGEPPRGLSGAIRRLAFKFSESEYGHWLPLLIADRVDMLEGLVDDIRAGHFPNILAEKGMKADLKYNKAGLAKKLLVAGAVTFVAVKLLSKDKKKERK
jgi:hypothetical protein